MAIDFQLQQASFKYGIDEGTDPHAVPLGVLTTLENFVWLKSGRVEKRAGITAIANTVVGGGSIASGGRLFTRGTELCVVNSTGFYALGTAGAAGWHYLGPVPDASLTWETVHDSYTGTKGACAGYANGCIVRAWLNKDPRDPTTVSGSDAFVEVLDATTKTKIMSAALTVNGLAETVRVLTLGTDAFVIYKQGTTIFARSIDLTTGTFTSLTMLRNDARASGLVNTGVDACIIGNTVVICYETGAGVLSLYSYTYAAGVFTQSVTRTVAEASSIVGPISIDGALGESLYLAYGVQLPAGKTRCAIVDATTLVTTVAPFDVDATTNASWVSVARFNATSCMYLDCTSDTTTRVISNAGAMTSKRTTVSSLPLSRPFVAGGKCYVYLADTSVSPAPVSAFAGVNTVLVESETTATTFGTVPHRYVGPVDILVGGAYRTGLVSNVPKLTSTKTIVMLPFLSDATPTIANWRCGLRLVSANFGADLATDHWRNVTVGREAYFCGGALSVYDGRTIFDYGFLRAPIIYSTSTAPLAAKVAAGTYLYSMVQEQRSHAGVLHRSPATAPITITLGASSTVTLNALGFAVGNKQNSLTGFGAALNDSPTTLPVFRTVAGGTIPQRLTYEPGFNTNPCDPRALDTFVDDKPDSNIGQGVALSARPALYTASGAKDDFPPQASLTMFYHADRLWTLSGDGLTWSYSKTFQDDLGTAPGFHPDFRVVFSEPQTCGETMDEKAIFFSPNGIKYMLGLGPAKDGTNSDFSTPIRINTGGAGCINPRSVVSTPEGLMFLSATGIYTLTRGLEVEWTGRRVQDTLALFPNITSAVLVSTKSEVRFTANAADGLSGVVLVYNYLEKQWSTSKYLQVGGVGTAFADACMYLGRWTFLTPAGTLYTESSTSSLDIGAYVPGVVETAWISAAGPVAWVSVATLWLQGVSQSDHELLLEAAFDSSDVYQQNRVFHAGSLVTSVGPLEECSLSIGTRRNCDSIRFRFTDSAPLTPGSALGTGKGPRFETMGILVGQLKGGNEPAGRKG